MKSEVRKVRAAAVAANLAAQAAVAAMELLAENPSAWENSPPSRPARCFEIARLTMARRLRAETPQGVAGSRSHKIFEIEVPTMNYDTLLTAAHDYISAYNDVRRTFPYGFTLWDSTLLHSEAAQKSICHDRCEAVFHALCESSGMAASICSASAHRRKA